MYKCKNTFYVKINIKYILNPLRRRFVAVPSAKKIRRYTSKLKHVKRSIVIYEVDNAKTLIEINANKLYTSLI
jgi:hypothetical protein